jgi:hypothetical protein
MPVAKDYLPGPGEQVCLCDEQDGPHIQRVCELDKKVKTLTVGGAIQRGDNLENCQVPDRSLLQMRSRKTQLAPSVVRVRVRSGDTVVRIL